jgi:hypothetical protein
LASTQSLWARSSAQAGSVGGVSLVEWGLCCWPASELGVEAQEVSIGICNDELSIPVFLGSASVPTLLAKTPVSMDTAIFPDVVNTEFRPRSHINPDAHLLKGFL